VLGVLAVAELVANWNPTLRMLLEESGWELYVKPVMAFCCCFGVIPHELGKSVVDPSLPTPESFHYVKYALPIVGSLGTYFFCKIRMGIADSLRTLDPDNDFKLHYLAVAIEECSWLLVFILIFTIPIIAAILVLIGMTLGFVFQHIIGRIAARRRQKWEEKSLNEIIRVLDIRFIVIFLIGVFISIIPVAGFIVSVLLLKMLVFSVLSLFESKWRRVCNVIFMRILKVMMLLIVFALSGIPLIGSIMLLPYIAFYIKRRKCFINTFDERRCLGLHSVKYIDCCDEKMS
jgi:membrane protein YqaA with SNARE-associated domain